MIKAKGYNIDMKKKNLIYLQYYLKSIKTIIRVLFVMLNSIYL